MTMQDIKFNGSMTLKHSNALVMPNGCDLVTARGDRAWFWLEKPTDPKTPAIMVKYELADGTVIWPSHYYGA